MVLRRWQSLFSRGRIAPASILGSIMTYSRVTIAGVLSVLAVSGMALFGSAAQAQTVDRQILTGRVDTQTLASSGFTQSQFQAVQQTLANTKRALVSPEARTAAASANAKAVAANANAIEASQPSACNQTPADGKNKPRQP